MDYGPCVYSWRAYRLVRRWGRRRNRRHTMSCGTREPTHVFVPRDELSRLYRAFDMELD